MNAFSNLVTNTNSNPAKEKEIIKPKLPKSQTSSKSQTSPKSQTSFNVSHLQTSQKLLTFSSLKPRELYLKIRT